jgi:hypothetical protein
VVVEPTKENLSAKEDLRPSESNLRPSAAKGAPGKRGGKRPGAGARKGNMNALKTGAYSKQFALLGRLLASDPKIRTALLAIAARADRKFKSANEVAAFLLTRYREHVEDQAAARYAPGARKPRGKRAGGLNFELPVDDWDSIKESAARFEGKFQK